MRSKVAFCVLFAEGNRAWLYMYGVESLTPCSRVPNNWRICMLHPKICYFSQKQTDFSSIHDKLAKNPKFLTDNLHGSRKSRVLICNTNTPLSLCNSSMCADSIFFFTSSPAKIWAFYNWLEKRFQEIPSQVIILGGGGVFKNWWIW